MKKEILRKVELINIVAGYLDKAKNTAEEKCFIDSINMFSKEIHEIIEGAKNE